MNLTLTHEFKNNWMYDGSDRRPFTLDVECRSLMIAYMDSASPAVGNASVYDNGELKIKIDPHIVGWTHANALIVFESDTTALHHVEVRLDEGSEDKKFTILGFGVVK